MVTETVFTQGMNYLAETFGLDKFKKRKKELFGMAAAKVPDTVFLKAIDNLVGNSRFSPTLGDFQEALRSCSKEYFDRVKERDTHQDLSALKKLPGRLKKVEIPGIGLVACSVGPGPQCQVCNDSGVVCKDLGATSAFPKMTYQVYFKCYCEKGRARPETWAILPRDDLRLYRDPTGEVS